MDMLKKLVDPIPDDAASILCTPISKEKIKNSMFSIGDGKAPGPDGYSAKVFKVSWHVVKHDVVAVV